ncbi:hypothetical protein WISP_116797 [Willisornis vidua]|uniref:Uncharacterized protein n=1 Tax=Willisornis vidua TaxID=1566151 RepID=A0ABQ9CUQ0_9PASS|nr:hypothetical protein WISP_116797 [Willisornis vidua]
MGRLEVLSIPACQVGMVAPHQFLRKCVQGWTLRSLSGCFSSAVPISLDQPFHFPIRASAAAVDEDASPKAIIITKAAAQPDEDLQ